MHNAQLALLHPRAPLAKISPALRTEIQTLPAECSKSCHENILRTTSSSLLQQTEESQQVLSDHSVLQHVPVVALNAGGQHKNE